MSRATALSTTSRNRKQTAKQPKQAVQPFLDPATLPDEYAMRVTGNCMAPQIKDGAQAVFSKVEKPKPGDLVILYFRPELVAPGSLPASIKRLVLAPPSYVKFPWREHPDSTVHALVICEQTNPPRQYHFKCENLLAIHKFIRTQGK